MQKQNPYDPRNHLPPLSKANPVSTMLGQVIYRVYDTARSTYGALLAFRDNFHTQIRKSFSERTEPDNSTSDLTSLFRKKK